MKKALLVLVAVFFVAISVNAVEAEFGVKAGVSLSNIEWGELPATPFTAFDNPFKMGITGGVTVEIPIVTLPYVGPVALGVEMLYSQKGERHTDGSDSISWNMSYIEFPIMAKVNIIPMVKVYGGVSKGFLTSAKVSYEIDGLEIGDVDIKDYLRKIDISAIAGFQVSVNKFVFDARYNHGITDVVEDVDGESFCVRFRTFYATVGYTF